MDKGQLKIDNAEVQLEHGQFAMGRWSVFGRWLGINARGLAYSTTLRGNGTVHYIASSRMRFRGWQAWISG